MIRLGKVSVVTLVALWVGSTALAFWLGGIGQRSAIQDGDGRQPPSGRAGAASASPTGGQIRAGGQHADPPLSGTPLRRDPVRALLGFAELGGGPEHPGRPRDLASTMDLEQVRAAVAELEQLGQSPSQQRALWAALGRWTQLEPAAAYAFVTTIGEPKRRHDAKLWILESWGRTDPAGALAHVEANPDSSIGRAAAAAVFDGLADGDPGFAMRFLESLGTGGSPHGHATYRTVRALFERGDREVIAWAETLPAGEIRDRSIHAVIDQWARYDPAAARRWMEEHASGDTLPGAQVELGESWARVDPAAALRWAEALEADRHTSERVKERIYNRWMQYDYETAAQFLVAQEPSPDLDRAFEIYIERARHYNPEATMAWAESITDPKRRARAIYRVGSIWKSRDNAALQSYLQNSGLDQNLIKKLR